MTKAVLLYLAHYQQDLSHTIAELYLAGRLEEAEHQGLKGRILAARDLCTLDLDGIQAFYGAAPIRPKRPAAMTRQQASKPAVGL